jgi:hypothetical protein
VTPPRRRYRTDLTDAQWQVLGSLIPQPKPGGRPVLHQRRELLNAMLYWRRAGCAWRLLAHDLPPGRPSTTTSAAGGWRGVGSGSCGYCALASGSARAGAHAERRSPGQPERADHRKGGAVRLRRRQASQRPQAPPAGRHPGAAAGRAREPRQRQRPGWRCRAAGPAGPTPAATAALWLGGRRLPRGIPGLGAGKVQDRLSGGGAR